MKQPGEVQDDGIELLVPDCIEGNQLTVLTALLANPTVTAAASVAGVSTPTVYRMMADPEFREALDGARRQLLHQSFAVLQAGMGKAIQTLTDVMDDSESPASSKVSAARVLLECSFKAVEVMDIKTKLEELEDRL